MLGFKEVVLSLFAATTVIIFVYALLCLISVGISLTMIFKGRREFSKGHMRKFINAFSITLAVSFVYAIWNVMTRLGIIEVRNEFVSVFFDNVILIGFIMLLTYVAYLAREFSKRFGFKSIGKKVGDMAKHGKRK